MKNVNSTKELKRNEKNSKFVYADEICVCCGNTSLPNDMLCKACKDKADEEKEKKMTNKEKFLELCKCNISRDGIKDLLAWLEKSDFYTAPASTRFHGNYEGGLLEHSLNVYDMLFKTCEMCKQNFSHETLAIVSLFHDLCKTYFYKKEFKNQKVGGKWVEKEVYVQDDQMPLGHGEKSVIIIQRFMQLTLEETLAIRWHMNGFDFAVKGGDYGLSKAQDLTKLVTLLQVADMLASGILEEAKNV